MRLCIAFSNLEDSNEIYDQLRDQQAKEGTALQTLAMEATQGARPPDMKRTTTAVATWSTVAVAVLAVFYFVTTLYIAAHRLFWFDELLTLRVAGLPDIGTFLQALAHPADGMPPAYYVVVRLFEKIFGDGEVAVRVPSDLAMIAGMLITFDCARRLTDALHGLIALSILTCSFLPYYGYETRSYAIYFMLSALAFWVWACTKADSKPAAVCFGAILFVAVTMHYYAVLCLVPYALWELSRWRPWQKPSPKLIAGVVGVGLPVALLARMLVNYGREFSPIFWSPTSIYQLRTVFSQLFPDGLFLLALIIIWIALVNVQDKPTVLQPMGAAESVGWLCLSMPLAGFLIALLKTKAFGSRYFVAALPGIAVAASCWLWRRFGNSVIVPLGICALLAASGIANQLVVVRHPESVDPFGQHAETRKYLKLEDALRDDNKQFHLFENPALYLQALHYSKRPEECVLMIEGDDLQTSSMKHIELNLTKYSPMQIWNLNDLRIHARETAWIEPKPAQLKAMKQAGYKVDVRFSEPMEVVYLQ